MIACYISSFQKHAEFNDISVEQNEANRSYQKNSYVKIFSHEFVFLRVKSGFTCLHLINPF